jgi:hypothetical protein
MQILFPKEGVVSDYLSIYLTDEGFDLPQLLNDDFFLAIKLLFNEGYFVSCAKLIVSFIDTIAFIEYGDVAGNYQRWLDTYVDLQHVGVTSEELWEYRNSLVHMTNLESRKVMSGKVKRLVPIVIGSGSLPVNVADLPAEDDNSKFMDLFRLIQSLSQGACGKWTQSFNDDREKFRTFIERYDLVISDKRQYMVSAANP